MIRANQRAALVWGAAPSRASQSLPLRHPSLCELLMARPVPKPPSKRDDDQKVRAKDALRSFSVGGLQHTTRVGTVIVHKRALRAVISYMRYVLRLPSWKPSQCRPNDMSASPAISACDFAITTRVKIEALLPAARGGFALILHSPIKNAPWLLRLT